MGLLDGLRKQAIDVIEWTEPDDETLAYRYPVDQAEIKNGARLTVRESQAALFVDQGEPADQFGPGLHTLETQNLPILTKLRSWPYGFKSPFKSDVYFYSLREKLDQRWGTPQPITLRDKEFGSVQIRMFGLFSYHLADAGAFYRKVSGTRAVYTVNDLAGQLTGTIAGAVPAAFAQSGLPFLDMAANQTVLSAALKKQLEADFAQLGLALGSFVIQSVTLPEALQGALADKQRMGIVGDLSRYAQFQAAQAIPEAARQSGGLAGAGVGLAAGAAIANQMTGAFAPREQQQQQAPQPQTGTVPCTSCGKQLEANSKFCKFCGKPQQRECPNCKTEAASDAAFCAKCGTRLA